MQAENAKLILEGFGGVLFRFCTTATPLGLSMLRCSLLDLGATKEISVGACPRTERGNFAFLFRSLAGR